MGICASCLGLNRHPSQENHETAALLDGQQAQYGVAGGGDTTQLGEEELRREREALEHITIEATDNMIDVVQPGTSEVSQHLAHAGSQRSTRETNSRLGPNATDQDAENEENAWLRSVEAAGAGDLIAVRGLQSNALVMDINQLREEPAPSAAKRPLKARLAG